MQLALPVSLLIAAALSPLSANYDFGMRDVAPLDGAIILSEPVEPEAIQVRAIDRKPTGWDSPITVDESSEGDAAIPAESPPEESQAI